MVLQYKKDEVLWYVMRAYKNEKKAEEVLSSEDGLPFFIPKRYIVQTCHGKKTRRLVPAIPSMVFVRASREQIAEFKLRYPFLQYVMWKKSEGLEYITVPDSQMRNFIVVASQYEENLTFYEPEELHLKKGQRIRILGGAFNGVEGIFVKMNGKRSRQLLVVLDGVAAVAVSVQPDLVEVLE